jgi:hypothetical protein
MGEVYGKAELIVSVKSKEKNEEMALLCENYWYSPLLQKKAYLTLEDIHGIKRELEVHNLELELDSFFHDGE